MKRNIERIGFIPIMGLLLLIFAFQRTPRLSGGDEGFVVEQGKGARRVTVERGRSYVYT